MALTKILAEFTKDQLSRLQQYGAKIIEWHQTDDYELFLIKDPHMERLTGYEYQIGFQRKGMDFTDFDQLLGKSIPDNVSISDLREVEKKVREWVKKYGEVGAGSTNKQKARKYARIFKRLGFKVEILEIEDKDQGLTIILSL